MLLYRLYCDHEVVTFDYESRQNYSYSCLAHAMKFDM